MKFGGIQKLTLLDYPGKVACTLFTVGCNFRCPFCHNASLVTHTDSESFYDEEYVLNFLEKRKGILEGVCITGGEPLLYDEIFDFIKKVKEAGYPVKLDTNGYFPEKLEKLIESGLIDYVAMDIKNSMEKYALTAGTENMRTENVQKSIELLLSGKTDYEFRTTVVKELHTCEDIEKIARTIQGAPRYFLQSFEDSGDIIKEGLSPHSEEMLLKMRSAALPYVQYVEVRGILQ